MGNSLNKYIMTYKTIYLPATQKHISMPDYINAWKTVIANPDAEFKHGLTTWYPQTGKEIRKDFIAGMMERINTRVPNNMVNLTIVNPNKK